MLGLSVFCCVFWFLSLCESVAFRFSGILLGQTKAHCYGIVDLGCFGKTYFQNDLFEYIDTITCWAIR